MGLPPELRYSAEHCWVLVVGESGRIGVCPGALTGTVEAVRLPVLGSGARIGDVVATLQTTTGDVHVRSPISGSVVLVNDRLVGQPSIIVEDPFGAGWLFEMQLSYDETLEQVMDAESYSRLAH